ncbi:hypothetical protein [Gordonia aurantiaca]|uniref:hypothetical protein n=1 Tax=Gordonia sp. B21 TaxID=3151852 RepID=UPI0032670B30
MSTRFDGRRGSRHDDLPLSSMPGWALEMMMGLYGPETIRHALAEEAERGVAPVPWDRGRVGEPERRRPGGMPEAEKCGRDDVPVAFNQFDAELEAMNSLVRFLGRKLRRR